MNLTEASLRNPAAVAAGVALIVLFGLISLARLPVQLFPDIENPQINIQTSWRAAAPREMEAEIVEPIEEVMQGLPGVKEMTAGAGTGGAWINLEFSVGTDMRKTMIEVISRMNRLPPLPRDADQPVINLGGWDGDIPALTWFFLQVLPGNKTPVTDYRGYVQDVIVPAIEAVPGVARAGLQGLGQDKDEVQIRFDPYRAADLGIQMPALIRAVNQTDDVSGGQVDVGRRQYTLRFAGKFDPATLSDLVLDWRGGKPVRLGDIADVRVDLPDRTSMAVQNGNPALGIRVDRESGANVLETMNGVKAVVQRLNDGPLKARGLSMAQSFDSSVFIYRAINLVTGNLALGVVLAVGILWWFLRRWRATMIVALAIPVSLLSTFIVLRLTGHTLNVISLAGLAFAVGMVLDAAIVVMENAVRLREEGKSAFEGALLGANQVWGALLASTATTVAIFAPVLFLADVEGQLFSDLALTIAIAVSISLLVAVTIVPLATSRLLDHVDASDYHAALWNWITNRVMALTSTARKRYIVIAVLIGVPLVTSWVLLPERDYLPPVKRDAVDSFFELPPATNLKTIDKEIVQVMVRRLKPYMDGVKEPALKNYYILIWPGGGTLGARVRDQSRVKELEKIVTDEITTGLPDFVAYTTQGDLFGEYGGDRSIPLQLQSRDYSSLETVAARAIPWLRAELPGAIVRAEPGLEQAQPELRLIPNDRSILEKGLTRADMGSLVRALGEGLWVGEYFDGIKRMDVILRARGWDDPDRLGTLPIATPNGGVVPLNQLVTVERTVGPEQINRVDRRRTLTLGVIPPQTMSLEKALTTIQDKVEPRIREILPPDANIRYGGSADQLKRAITTMGKNFGLAILILFLLMSALFRSVRDSLLVVLAMPLATIGSVVALRLLNLVAFQPLDLLTMIGFVIMLGLVVNNAILLVDQTRSAERAGLNRHHAVEQSLRYRLRPIFMSTLTSIFGMLPLLLMPGAGSVIYRGLAAVIVGGLSVSTLFTLVLLPSFLRMGGGQPALISENPAPTGRTRVKLESVSRSAG